MADTRFIRLGSPSVAAQVHVSPDSRYILLPILQQAARITGWLVYDSVKGTVLTNKELGRQRDYFDSMHAARDWVNTNLASREAS